MTHPTPGLEQGLTTLLERVRAAAGPDRELDHDIMLDAEPAGWHTIPNTEDDRYSASIDTALSLVARVLPGWRFDVHSPRFGTPFEAVLMDGDSASRKIVVAKAATAPLAILAALLSALSRANGEQP